MDGCDTKTFEFVYRIGLRSKIQRMIFVYRLKCNKKIRSKFYI